MENLKSDLELKFRQTHKEITVEIDKEIAEANSRIKEAIKLSETYGVPFSIDLDCMPRYRRYMPSTFDDKWKALKNEEAKKEEYPCGNKLEELCEEFDIRSFDDDGFEYWNPSSLSC